MGQQCRSESVWSKRWTIGEQDQVPEHVHRISRRTFYVSGCRSHELRETLQNRQNFSVGDFWVAQGLSEIPSKGVEEQQAVVLGERAKVVGGYVEEPSKPC